jgi:membrane protease YdiL (CAAX protease family)
MLKKTNDLLYEMIAVMGFTVLFSFLYPEYKSLITLIPLIYLLIERAKRGRSWNDIGFKFNETLSDLKNNWYLIILVVIITQVLTLGVGEYFLPGFLQHIQARIPLINPSQLILFMIMLMSATLGEELIFRVFFQERLSWYISVTSAILISSAVFASLHYAGGPFFI